MSFSGSEFLTLPAAWLVAAMVPGLFGNREWLHATGISVQTALITTVLATALGTVAAYGLHRTSTAWGGTVYAVLLLPVVTPPSWSRWGCSCPSPKLGSTTRSLGWCWRKPLWPCPSSRCW